MLCFFHLKLTGMLFFSFILLIFDVDAATCTKNNIKNIDTIVTNIDTLNNTPINRFESNPTDGRTQLCKYPFSFSFIIFNPFGISIDSKSTFLGMGRSRSCSRRDLAVVVVVQVSLHAGQFLMDVKIAAAGLSRCQNKLETATCQHS